MIEEDPELTQEEAFRRLKDEQEALDAIVAALVDQGYMHLENQRDNQRNAKRIVRALGQLGFRVTRR